MKYKIIFIWLIVAALSLPKSCRYDVCEKVGILKTRDAVFRTHGNLAQNLATKIIF